MNRRDFLNRSILFTGALCLDWKTFADTLKTKGKPQLCVGVLSDVHITNEESAGTLRKALMYYRDRGVDAIIIAGDIADNGQECELEVVAQVWYEIFPKDKLPNREHVEKVFVLGNHDKVFDNKRVRRNIPDDKQRLEGAFYPKKEKVWKRLFHEKFQQFYLKKIKGYCFVGANFLDYTKMPGLSEYFESIHDQLPTDKPFFYIQHVHPKGTCSSPYVKGQDDGISTKLLSRYPNCISFSGHSHTPLTDERTIWQGAFTSVGTASLSYLIPFLGRENYRKCRDGKQGMLMTVYEDSVALERREFVYDQALGDNWIIPLPHTSNPYSLEGRTEKCPAPEFGPEDKVTQKMEEERIVVSFPTVTGEKGGTRAYDYEVVAEVQEMDVRRVASSKRIYSDGFYLAPQQDRKEVTCDFNLSDLPKNKDIRIAVRPCNCFGKMGEAIHTDFFRMEEKEG